MAFPRRKLLIGGLVSVVGMIALLESRKRTRRTPRYRLTLEAETPEGLRSGSSVVEVTFAQQSPFDSGVVWSRSFRGEATAVDLGARGVLFALLTGDPARPRSLGVPDQMIGRFPMVGQTLAAGEQGAAQLDAAIRLRPRREIPLDQAPLLVRFRDIADPMTVERVDPNDLGASFGPGVRLVRVTIEITDSNVTEAIRDKLIWTGWPKERWSKFSVDGREPMRIALGDGKHVSLPRTEFSMETVK